MRDERSQLRVSGIFNFKDNKTGMNENTFNGMDLISPQKETTVTKERLDLLKVKTKL